MSFFSRLQSALSEHLGGRAARVRVKRGNELHCQIERGDAPLLAELLRNDFNAELILMVANDRRADKGVFEIHYLFAQSRENWFLHATKDLTPEHPAITSLATFYYPASRFEREIKDLFGIPAVGHPDPRPLVRHAFWPQDYFPLRKDAAPPDHFEDDGTPFPFQPVGGEGVYEIPVGPVHAGIIEPGHFRFSVVGETVIDLKARLYFTHKGTEKLFEGRLPAEGVELAERISGDATVGHSLAYCQAVESLAGTDVPARARYLRVILLELERLYNHIADFGVIANDTGFAVAHAHCSRLRERVLRLNRRITGNRLLRGSLLPGGVGRDLPAGLDLPAELEEILADFNEVVGISLNNTILMDRLEGTGRLTTETATDHGVLGYVARASGIDVDVRRDHPFAAYGEIEPLAGAARSFTGSWPMAGEDSSGSRSKTRRLSTGPRCRLRCSRTSCRTSPSAISHSTNRIPATICSSRRIQALFTAETRRTRRCTENPDASVKSPCPPCLRGETGRLALQGHCLNRRVL